MIPDSVFFVVGPTAVGKSAYAVRLALENNGEIISADSMQVYIGLDSGTSKPSEDEKQGVVHHMIDIIDPGEDYSAGAYSKDAQACIKDIIERGKQPIVCGGTGLYIHALLYNEMDFSERERDDAFREELARIAELYGSKSLHDKLYDVDPEAAARIHPNNLKRVIRALERAGGDIENSKTGGLRDFSETFGPATRYKARIIRLTTDRQKLYERIECRAEAFFAAGLIDEVDSLLKKGIQRNSTAMQGIGYKEVAAMLNGEYDEMEALRLVKQNTRRYAKRQEAWFKRYSGAETIIL